MAITPINVRGGSTDLKGLSSDTKPTVSNENYRLVPNQTLFVETDTGVVSKWMGAGWHPVTSGGTALVKVTNQEVDVIQNIEHIPAGTAAATDVAGSSWIYNEGYDSGVIHVGIFDGTPAGDLAGNVQAKFSNDAGVTSTAVVNIESIANIGADDSQDIFIDFNQLIDSSDANGFQRLIRLMPYFKININFSAGTLAAVTCSCHVTLRKRKF